MYVDTNGTLFDLGYVVAAMGSFTDYIRDGVQYREVSQVIISESKLYQFSIRTYLNGSNNYQFKNAYFCYGDCAIWYVAK